MDTVYRHRQSGGAIATALFVGILVTAWIALASGKPDALAALVALTLAQFLFSSLTVEVDATVVRWMFGVGWLRFSVPLEAVRDVRTVRNPWWYGWGIHLTPHGWLFNVSGLHAVELKLASGRTLRIGTDEPENLADVLRAGAMNRAV